MSREFDKGYWEAHWAGAQGAAGPAAHPALVTELAGVLPGTAVDAGSGEGAEATWLAAHGWTVTAVDISANALRRAATGSARTPDVGSVTWVEADLTEWEPDEQLDLVATFYAHPAMPQHAFYERIGEWVAPGGTLLIVGHHHGDGQAHAHEHPENAVTAPEQVRALLDPEQWVIRTAEIRERIVTTPRGTSTALRDVIVRAEKVRDPGLDDAGAR